MKSLERYASKNLVSREAAVKIAKIFFGRISSLVFSEIMKSNELHLGVMKSLHGKQVACIASVLGHGLIPKKSIVLNPWREIGILFSLSVMQGNGLRL